MLRLSSLVPRLSSLVLSGGLMFLGGGSVALVAYLGGFIRFWPIGIGVVGFFIMLNGLMGEEGVW